MTRKTPTTTPAVYGEPIVSALSRQLASDYGRDFAAKYLRHMLGFAEVFPNEQIVTAPRRQLNWAHYESLIYTDTPLKCDFHAKRRHSRKGGNPEFDAQHFDADKEQS